MPADSKAKKVKRRSSLFNNNNFSISYFNRKRKGSEVEDSLSKWMNERSISFTQHRDSHYEDYLTKVDERLYQSRSSSKFSPIPENIFPWKFNINPAHPVYQKTWSDE